MASCGTSKSGFDVAVWLERLGLDEYAAAFVQHKIDDAALTLLSDADLKELGVAALGDRRKLTAAIAALRRARRPDGSDGTVRQPSDTAPLAYTPEHLAARILNERDGLQGERKHVTVLFADIKDSTKLIARADPEEAAQTLGPTISLMMSAVHAYEGTVNRVQGDGIMALFGAPLAHEDHAQRACLAALAMRDAVANASDPSIEIRIGLHSGDVLVRTIHNDLSMDYDALGATVHLASRMEHIATPGAIFITAATNALAAGFFETRSMPTRRIKGVGRPMEVFELVRRAPAATRWEARSTRDLTSFVGRKAELAALAAALRRARAGRGELLALVGDAGMGKSRLVHELIQSPAAKNWRIVQTGTSPFGETAAFMPLGLLLRSLFGIREGDGGAEIVTRIEEGLAEHDAATPDLLTIIRFLLNMPVSDPSWLALDPQQRRERIIVELQGLLLNIARRQALLIVFEDLHWIDPETRRLLDALATRLEAHPLVLLVTYRPGFQDHWAANSHYTRIGVDALGDENAHAMLDALLGPATEFDVLKRLLIERTEGRPLFIEEIVRSLEDSGVIAEADGALRLTGTLDRIELPGSVQDVIASRIDRLEPALKRLLQTASVIGRNIPLALIKFISDETASNIERRLAELARMEFLYESGDDSRREYRFKHALIEEVAYTSLLQPTRRALHGLVMDAYEAEYADRLVEYYEVIARHAITAENWPKAHDYSRKAAQKAHARSAYQAAVDWFEQAVAALEAISDGEDRIADKMDVRLEMRIALWPLGQHDTLARRVREAGALAEQAGDTTRLAWVHNYLTAHHWQAGEHAAAIEMGERGIALAEQAGDFSARVTTMQHLGLALLARGDYRRQTALHREVVEALVGDRAFLRHGMAGYPASLSRGFLAYGLIELGDFDEAFRRTREGLDIAREVNSAMTSVWVTNIQALAHLRTDEPEPAVALMRSNFALCRKSEMKLLYSQTAGLLGHALTAIGRPNEGIAVLEQAVRPENLDHHTEGLGYPIVWLAMALLAGGNRDAAFEAVRRALQIATRQGERGHKAWALYARGEIEAAGGADPERARTSYNMACRLADRSHMHPLVARCKARLAAL